MIVSDPPCPSAARLKAIEVEALKAGLIAPPAEPPRPVVNLKTLSAAVDHYLSMVEAQRSPKNWEERAVPLPTPLMDRLQQLKESRNAVPAQLVFLNKHGNPHSNQDMVVKPVAAAAA